MTQLTFHQQLDYYDGPIEFSATDPKGNLYIAVAYTQETPARQFIAVPVTQLQLQEYCQAESDLHELMLQNGKCQWFRLTLHDNGAINTVEQNTPIQESGLLPEPEITASR